MLDPLGPDLDLLPDLKDGPHLFPSRIGDQDLAANRVGLDPGCEIDVAAYHSILRSLRRTDISHHDLPSMNPDADLHFGQIVLPVVLIDRRHS